MANYHSDEWIMDRLKEHYTDALKMFNENRIIGIFIQGSQNYGLDYKSSDIDTKVIITPTLEEIAFNKKAYSTTHVRDNNEHIDIKDIRLYIETFRKQNINFLEVLFTKYKIINPQYATYWNELVQHREKIARYNPRRGLAAIKGVALEKYHALEHPYPSKIDIINKYGYDSKQLHHLFRVEDFMENFLKGHSYESCLTPSQSTAEFLKLVKRNNNWFSLKDARTAAANAVEHVKQMYEQGIQNCPEGYNEDIEELLQQTQYEIIKYAITQEILKENNK